MKDAMTDHKADHVAVLQEIRDAIAVNPYFKRDYWSKRLGALDAAIAALTAAPAASEGEDGAVAWLSRRHSDGLLEFAEPNEKASNPEHWSDAFPVYTRPAAQVAATPKHDEGRGAVEAALLDMADAAAKADSSNCTPSQSREQWARYDAAEKIVRRALATQPAARRVTDDPDWRGLYRTQTAMRYMDASPQLSLADAQRMADEDIQRLESFAQPAEGVSGG